MTYLKRLKSSPNTTDDRFRARHAADGTIGIGRAWFLPEETQIYVVADC